MLSAFLISARRALKRFCCEDRAAQIVEFAVSLPLLVVFVVGIFDFSSAISLKQKLMTAAREAARVAAADPATDLEGAASGVPASVSDAKQLVDNYLISENINNCGFTTAALNQTAGTMTWVATSNTGCPGTGINLQINRGCVTTVASGVTTVHVVDTCITLSYAYNWRFNGVISLLGGNARGSGTLTAKAEAFNEN